MNITSKFDIYYKKYCKFIIDSKTNNDHIMIPSFKNKEDILKEGIEEIKQEMIKRTIRLIK